MAMRFDSSEPAQVTGTPASRSTRAARTSFSKLKSRTGPTSPRKNGWFPVRPPTGATSSMREAVLARVAVHERGLFLDAHGDPVGIDPTQGDILDSTSSSLMLEGGYDLTTDRMAGFMVNDLDLERNGDYVPVPGDRALGIPSGTAEGDPGLLVGVRRATT